MLARSFYRNHKIMVDKKGAWKKCINVNEKKERIKRKTSVLDDVIYQSR